MHNHYRDHTAYQHFACHNIRRTRFVLDWLCIVCMFPKTWTPRTTTPCLQWRHDHQQFLESRGQRRGGTERLAKRLHQVSSSGDHRYKINNVYGGNWAIIDRDDNCARGASPEDPITFWSKSVWFIVARYSYIKMRDLEKLCWKITVFKQVFPCILKTVMLEKSNETELLFIVGRTDRH